MRNLIASFIFIVTLMACSAWAGHQDGFTVTVIHNENPLSEIDRQVTMPFNEEYKIRLNNTYDRRCSVRVYIDGALVSNLGDFIIRGGSELALERFVNDSLTEGKCFKFVPLDHPDVPDPNRKENGTIKVEFRLEQEREKYIVPTPEYFYYKWEGDDGCILLPYQQLLDTFQFNTFSTTFINCSNVSPGATIGGSMSHQKFRHTEFEPGDVVVTVSLRIVGSEGDS